MKILTQDKTKWHWWLHLIRWNDNDDNIYTSKTCYSVAGLKVATKQSPPGP